MSSEKPNDKRRTPEEFDSFEKLTRRLIRVPKREIDDAVKKDKKRRVKRP